MPKFIAGGVRWWLLRDSAIAEIHSWRCWWCRVRWPVILTKLPNCIFFFGTTLQRPGGEFMVRTYAALPWFMYVVLQACNFAWRKEDDKVRVPCHGCCVHNGPSVSSLGGGSTTTAVCHTEVEGASSVDTYISDSGSGVQHNNSIPTQEYTGNTTKVNANAFKAHLQRRLPPSLGDCSLA